MECGCPSDLSAEGLPTSTLWTYGLHTRLQNLDPVCTGVALIVAVGRRRRLEKSQRGYRHHG